MRPSAVWRRRFRKPEPSPEELARLKLGEELTRLIREDRQRQREDRERHWAADEERSKPLPRPTVRALLEETNQRRLENGVGPLRLSPQLLESAQVKADDMAANNYYGHLSPTLGYPPASENLAYPGPNRASCWGGHATAIQQWMHSPGHKDNLLRPGWTKVGFGIAGRPNGAFVVVGHFG